MDAFGSWLFNNWLTIVSLVASGLISLVISRHYYRKGNRDGLKMTVIFPIVRVLQGQYSRSNYHTLVAISKSYDVRHMAEDEKKALCRLVDSYQDICSYIPLDVNVEILRSYFEYTLTKNGIPPNPVPFDTRETTVLWDYPPGMEWFSLEIKAALNLHDPDFDAQECQSTITELFNRYCADAYRVPVPIPFFKDHPLLDVLEQSVIREKWRDRLALMAQAKDRFLALDITQEVCGLLARTENQPFASGLDH